jgi:hypothetical protein
MPRCEQIQTARPILHVARIKPILSKTTKSKIQQKRFSARNPMVHLPKNIGV